MGKTRNALADFNHGETLTSRESDWFLNKALKVRDELEVVENGADKSLVGNILDTFEKEVLPNYVSDPGIRTLGLSPQYFPVGFVAERCHSRRCQ